MVGRDPIRDVGSWSLRKVEYLKNYLGAFADVTQGLRKSNGSVIYLDLFAGPGRLRNRESGAILPGSPLIAMEFFPKINKFVWVDQDKINIHSLQQLSREHGNEHACHILQRDCNEAIIEILDEVPISNSAAFTFLDPQRHNLHWATVKAIAERKSSARYKIEQFILFPYNMSIVRTLPRQRPTTDVWSEKTADDLDNVMPDGWRWRIVDEAARNGEINRDRELRRRFLYLYWRGLKDLRYLFVPAPKLIHDDSGRPLYFMFFASDHHVGDKVMNYVLHEQAREGTTLPMKIPDVEAPYTFDPHEEWYEVLRPPMEP